MSVSKPAKGKPEVLDTEPKGWIQEVINPLEERLVAVEEQSKESHDKLLTPHLFEVVLCDAMKTQSNIKGAIKVILLEQLATDSPARIEIKKILKEIVNDDWKLWMRTTLGKVVTVGGAIILLVIGALIQKWIG